MPGTGQNNERQGGADQQYGSAPLSDSALGSGLRHALKQILTSEDPEDHKSGRQLLLAFSEQHGAYIIAARLRVLIDSVGSDRRNDDREGRKRAYAMMAELLQGHLRDCVAKASQGDTTVGPNLFSTYCSEYVEACLSGLGLGHTMRSVVPIAERLTLLCIDKPSQRDYFASLANVMWKDLNDQVQVVAASAGRVSRDERGRAIRPTAWEAAEYTAARYDSMRVFSEKLKQVAGVEVTDRAQLQGSSSPEVANRHMGYIVDALGAANAAQAIVASAYLQETAGSLLVRTEPLRARKSWASALQHYEEQGDVELTFGLITLSEVRFKRGAEIAQHIGDEDSATRLTFKARHNTASSPTPIPQKRDTSTDTPTPPAE